jgi:hypothetical protein
MEAGAGRFAASGKTCREELVAELSVIGAPDSFSRIPVAAPHLIPALRHP